MTRIPIFVQLVVETQADCNRACRTCLRVTYPDKARIAGRSEPVQLATELVHKIIDEAAGMGFRGPLCLNFFNEPLLDPRLGEIGRHAKGTEAFSEVYANTNGDFFNVVDVQDLDGSLDRFNVALYGPDAPRRQDRIRSLFRKSVVTFTGGRHVVTHHSPYRNLEHAVAAVRDRPCIERARKRLIIAHTGDMLLCCEDIAGEWGLGNVGEHSLEELWFSSEHTRILRLLAEPGGRASFPYCTICPR